MKLYDKEGNFKVSVPTPSKRIPALTHYNNQGLYIKSQFNPSMTKVVRSYALMDIVNPQEVFKAMEKSV